MSNRQDKYFLEINIECVLEIDGKKTKATLSIMPLYDPADLRTKG